MHSVVPGQRPNRAAPCGAACGVLARLPTPAATTSLCVGRPAPRATPSPTEYTYVSDAVLLTLHAGGGLPAACASSLGERTVSGPADSIGGGASLNPCCLLQPPCVLGIHRYLFNAMHVPEIPETHFQLARHVASNLPRMAPARPNRSLPPLLGGIARVAVFRSFIMFSQ